MIRVTNERQINPSLSSRGRVVLGHTSINLGSEILQEHYISRERSMSTIFHRQHQAEGIGKWLGSAERLQCKHENMHSDPQRSIGMPAGPPVIAALESLDRASLEKAG